MWEFSDSSMWRNRFVLADVSVRLLWPLQGEDEASVNTRHYMALNPIKCCHWNYQLPPQVFGWPPFLLRDGWFSRMWMASFTSSSLAVLAQSITEISSYLIGWWLIHACSANADFSSAPFWHASLCSFTLASSLLTVSSMKALPQLQGMR